MSRFTRISGLRLVGSECIVLPLLLLLAMAWASNAAAAADGPVVELGEKGVKSLRWGQTELLTDFGLSAFNVTLLDAAGQPVKADPKPRSQTFDAATGRATVDYAWGRVEVTLASAEGRLDITATVHNTSPDTLHELRLRLLAVGFAQKPRRVVGRTESAGEPGVVGLQGDGPTLTVVNSDLEKPLLVELAEVKGKPGDAASRFELRLAAGGYGLVDDMTPRLRPIAPGAADTYRLSLRLAAPGSDLLDNAADVIDDYRRAHPALLRWPDRRPILRLFFGGGLPIDQVLANRKDPANAKLPTEPDPKFKHNTLNKIRNAIAAARHADAQGVVLWDLEGDRFPHATTYIGDPRNMKWLHPEMDMIADEMFKLLDEAKLLHGVCIRPSRVDYRPEKHIVNHSYGQAKDPFTELDDKIAYCRQRWGSRLFYIDTNFFWRPRPPKDEWQSGMIHFSVLRRLMEKHPDILLIPEFGSTAYYGTATVYGEADLNTWGTPPLARRLYPESFRTVVIEDADPYENFDKFVWSVRERNVLMTFGIGTGGNVNACKRIYEAAALSGAKPPQEVTESLAQPDRLAALLASESQPVRYHAALALGTPGIGPAPANPALGTSATAALAAVVANMNEDWLVRRAAALALVTRVQAGAEVDADLTNLLVSLAGDRTQGLYPQGVDALAAMGKPGAAAALTAFVQLTEGQRSVLYYQALGQTIARVADPDSVPPLLAVVRNDQIKDRRLRDEALRTLGAIGGQASEAAILDLFNTDGELRAAAADALARLKTPSADKAFKDAIDAAKKDGNKEWLDRLNMAQRRAQ